MVELTIGIILSVFENILQVIQMLSTVCLVCIAITMIKNTFIILNYIFKETVLTTLGFGSNNILALAVIKK